MSSNLKLKLMLDAFDNVTGPLKNIVKGSRETSNQLRKQQGAMRALQKQQSNITSFQRMRGATRNLKKDFDEARIKTEALKDEINRTGVPTKGLIRKFELASKASDKLESKHKSNTRTLRKLKAGLSSTGINTRNLTSEQKRLTHEIDNANGAIDTQKRRLSSLAKLQHGANNVTAAGGKVLNKAGNLAKKGIVATGIASYFFKTQLLDTASEFENYEAVLRVVEGTSAKARKALTWSSTFAAKTPFELNAITEAYVKLRTYGLNPTNGLLQTLGDTSAAMNKPLLQSVEAIADAITGENERLKEFGITSSKAGDKTTFNYVDKQDKQQSLTINGKDRKAIENALKTIWNNKFKGAMIERAKTWSGMLSNMGDHWKNFAMMVMGEGLFDWMKTKLGGLLTKMDAMAKDGSLQTLAKNWGNKLTVFATGAWSLGNALVSTTSKMADMVGGGENLLLLIAGISLAPLVTAIVSLGTALVALGGFIAGTAAFATLKVGIVAIGVALGPVGLAIAALSLAGLAIYNNWGGLTDGLLNSFNKIRTQLIATRSEVISQMAGFIKYIVDGVKSIYASLGDVADWLLNKFDQLLTRLKPITDVLKTVANGVKSIFPSTDKVSQFFSNTFSNPFDNSNSDEPSPAQSSIKAMKSIANTDESIFPDLKKLNQFFSTVFNQPLNKNNADRPAPSPNTTHYIQSTHINKPVIRSPITRNNNQPATNKTVIENINVHPAPGMNETQLANKVAAAIAENERKKSARHRSHMRDTE